MEEPLKCVFCDDFDVNLILFTEETLEKCRTILKHRKEHDLKFNDVALPEDLFESGYHRKCYKSFTGLMKIYYSSKAAITEKSAPEEKTENMESSSAVCSSTSKLNPRSIERQFSVPNFFPFPSTSSIPDPITMPEPSIVPELVETVASNLPENTEHLENIDSPSETNNLVESNSLTSSRKIIDIIHRYGHCISYSAIEELETEATYTSVQKSESCPETIVKSPHLCTGVAFDNFDRFVETKSGKDTLHDTVGIIYQNIDLHTPDELQFVNLPAANNEMHLNSNKRRRRTFEAVTVDVREEPFAKKKKNYVGLSSHHEGE
ncbi:hypothetical protein JTE90_001721 [Oedothorax gibbosus]|uniref:Uncharacterized protein n=1 Tax=Oedothorax gibbosus TaxID=931172 RepID=A0AAV6U2Z8_9ARAC|nr:hypothetical protein JTE90_001721 [Oedothorax gibbosus]